MDIFCKIASGEVGKDFIYEDEELMVFEDIHPEKPVHLLIVPKKHVVDFIDVEDHSLFQKIMKVAQKMVKEKGLVGKGYRLKVNGGGHQLVDHLHFHLIGPMEKAK